MIGSGGWYPGAGEFKEKWDSQDDKMGRGALVCVAEVGVAGEVGL